MWKTEVKTALCDKRSASQSGGRSGGGRGRDDPRVISDISDTVMALFRVEAHKIKVVKMSSSRE